MKYQGVLFDLDGTLTASGEGITKSVQYALKKMGRPDLGKDQKKLEVFDRLAGKADEKMLNTIAVSLDLELRAPSR